MRKVLRGYAKGKQGDLIQIGTIPVPHSKDKPSPSERQDKRDLVRRGATIFKKEMNSFSRRTLNGGLGKLRRATGLVKLINSSPCNRL